MKRFGCPVECTPEAVQVGKRKEISRGEGAGLERGQRLNDCGCVDD
jgi:hypothetical protein